MKLSVFGLGYVGAVTAACLARLGHQVIGVDIVKYKVDFLNNGESPVEEKGLREIIKEEVGKGRLSATTNSKEAVLNSEISFVCVGTPPKKDGDIDIGPLKRTVSDIGKVLKEKRYHIIVIRSTIFPGTLEKIKKTIEEVSNKKAGEDFDLAVNPEFLREGSAIKDFFYPPYIIVGSEKKEVCKKIFKVYERIRSKKFVVNEKIAQALKYVNNSWHALKVVFTNEISSICKELGIDSKKLMGLFCEDKQLNISPYYLKPGFAYGGSCLPKDTEVLRVNAKKLGLNTPIINSIQESNFEHIKRAIRLIESLQKKKIGILGITFKEGVGDIRGNPLLSVIDYFLDKGYEIKIYDKLIDESDVELLNMSYRKEVFDFISKKDLKKQIGSIASLFSSLDDVLNQDIVVVSNRDNSLKEFLKKLKENQIIVDLQNLFKPEDFKARYEHL